ncbi:MAG TPA: DUF3426 domain-containing protein [Caulobacteraceae bacterium]|jgi:predicted Zn finger-like uncharacterized protein|nr:DUF3426 domain-containing protein [Caulobacteraceae bacterium]
MILTCPECATRYFVDDDRVGTSGRTVRCAACGSNWRATPEQPPLDLKAGTEPAPVVRTAELPSFAAPDAGVSDIASSMSSSPDVHKTFRAKVEQKRKVREAAAAGVVWGLMCAAFALLLGAAYLFRVDVVKLYPKAAGAYAWVGAPVNPTGLSFEKIAATPAPDGLAAVTVSGQVRNVIGRAASAPPIRVALIDKSGARIASQILRLPTVRLAPGKVQAFSVSLPDPKGSAVDVDVAFALDLAQPAQSRPRTVAVHPAPVHTPTLAATPSVAPAITTAKPASAAAVSTAVKAPVSKPAANKATPAPTRLRPPLGVATQRAEDAKPLPANDPYALTPQG